MTVTDPPSLGKDEDGNDLEPVYEDPDEFYREYVAPTFQRDLGSGSDSVFCIAWTEHPEAVLIMDALWRSWEDCTLDDGRGLAYWLTMFAYPLLGRLMGERGPFDGCSDVTHKPRVEPLP
jgi:hypothetical protein